MLEKRILSRMRPQLFFLVVKHLEWHTASSSAVLGLENSIAGFKANGFVVHFCAYICVAFRAFETRGPSCVTRMDGVFEEVVTERSPHLLSFFSLSIFHLL